MRQNSGRADHLRGTPRLGSFPRHSMQDEVRMQVAHPSMANPERAPQYDTLQHLWRTVREDLRAKQRQSIAGR
jgi:hypothetical protein